MKTMLTVSFILIMFACSCATSDTLCIPAPGPNWMTDEEFLKLARDDTSSLAHSEVEVKQKPRAWFIGAWVGSCNFDLSFVRIVFEPDGSAVVGRSTSGGSVEVIKSIAWHVTDGIFHGEQNFKQTQVSETRIQGVGIRNYLVSAIQIRGWRRNLTLHREDAIQAEFRRLTQAMAEQ